MEIWTDQLTNKHYNLDYQSGTKEQCDRFGLPRQKFSHYSTGYPRKLDNFSPIKSKLDLYQVQTKKFDGYAQFPRPLVRPFFNDINDHSKLKPYKPGCIPVTRLPDDITKIPLPTSYLKFPSFYEGQFFTPKCRTQREISTLEPSPHMKTLTNLRTEQVESVPGVVKSAKSLRSQLNTERIQSKGYIPKQPIKERPKLKGTLMVKYTQEHELFKKNNEIIEKSNPQLFKRRKLNEKTDRKNLEKRHQQRLLLSKL